MKMFLSFAQYYSRVARLSIAAVGVFAAASSYAQSMGSYTVSPKAVDQGVAPLVMLAMSNDHQLYFKAYTDFDDLDQPGEVGFGELNPDETTYNKNFPYAGYFSSAHCYKYTTANARFEIDSVMVNKKCSGAWSGNFLNWATMTRIDILRKILYGGKRSTDTAGVTVLERSHLPNDAHSFAKFYKGDGVNKLSDFTPYSAVEGITICNTTLHNVGESSATTNQPPIMRVIAGNHSLWASVERYQCITKKEFPVNSPPTAGEAYRTITDIDGLNVDNLFAGIGFEPASQVPADTTNIDDFNVRVEACPSAFNDSLNADDCTTYSETNLKPEGLLQQYGLNETVNFGLMTGGYEHNKTGGVLRKNIGSLTTDVRDDGTFVANAGSIFNILDSFRVSQWHFRGGFDTNPDDPNAYVDHNVVAYNPNCRWGVDNGFPNSDGSLGGTASCADWGNPIGEILADSYRYFAGLAAINGSNVVQTEGAYTAQQEALAPTGVTVDQWRAFTDANYKNQSCANLNVLGLNAGAQTFDNNIDDFLTGIEGTPTMAGINTLTNAVGNAADDPINGGFYFVYSNGDGTNVNHQTCGTKTLSNLANAEGVCPESPRKKGAWDIAGLARYVSELGSTKDINSSHDGEQTIKTHGVQLTTALPQVEVGQGITLTPYCENMGGGNSTQGNCALVDFRVVRTLTAEQNGVVYVNWEDSEQGGDFDQDMHGLITYGFNDAGKLEVTTQVIGQSTTDKMGFGYVITGVTEPGVNFLSGINGFTGGKCAPKTGAYLINHEGNVAERDRKGCGINHLASSDSYTSKAGGDSVARLKSPLEYAAKASCGRFINNKNPSELKADLNRIISSIGPSTPAGGGEASASQASGSGPGLYLHTVYYAKRQSASEVDECNSNEVVTWVGQVGALFMDEQNRLREDTDGNDALSDLDMVISITNRQDDKGNPIVEVYAPNAAAKTEPSATKTIDQINYIWSTTETLGTATPGDRNMYTSVVETAPVNTNLITTANAQTLPLAASSFEGDTESLLDTDDKLEQILSYLSGTDYPVYRNRTLAGTKYLLGDITTSPVVQGAPDYSYASELGDPTYSAYVNQYKNARKVAYVASNDGMIHAFNAGVYNAGGNGYAGGDVGENEYVLGEELWAYAPFNLLPHLKWLADPLYQRVPYFDGYMRTFDIKAFTPDAIHPGGWGTILVVGTGMGGGHYPINFDGDDAGTTDITTRPAYIVLDITDRNAKRPTLIAEISHDELGFTTGEPDVIRVEKGGVSGWYLVFGSGPRGADLTAQRSAQLTYVNKDLTADGLEKPRLFALRFNKGAGTAAFAPPTLQQPLAVEDAADNAFIGAINGIDWDRDFQDDAIYFGTVAGTQAAPTGKLMRAALTFGDSDVTFSPSVVVNTNKPVTQRPVTVINGGNYWLFAGTGRHYVRSDGNATNDGNMYLGLMEPKGTDTVLTDTTFELGTHFVLTKDIRVAKSGALMNSGVGTGDNEVRHIAGLRHYLTNNEDGKFGWVRYFDTDERQHTISGYLASTLFVSTTTPSNAATCEASGDIGKIYLFDMRSGVLSPNVGDAYTESSTFTTGTGTAEVKEINLPVIVNGGGVHINDPSSTIAVGVKSEALGLPEIEFNSPSQRHSWREVTIPW